MESIGTLFLPGTRFDDSPCICQKNRWDRPRERRPGIDTARSRRESFSRRWRLFGYGRKKPTEQVQECMHPTKRSGRMRGGAPSARTSANEAKKSRIDSTVEKTRRKTGRTGWTDGETVVVGSETGRDTARRRLRPSSHIEHLVTRVVGRRRRLRRIGRAADGETSR